MIDRSKDTGRTLSIGALLTAATLASFWPVLHNDFTSLDDLGYVTNNPHVVTGLSWPNLVWAFQLGYAGNWHPITWLSHMLDEQIFGLNPIGHHLTSLLLHVANTILLLLVLKRLTAATWRSGFVAALFALHPLHVESVAWTAERKDVLSTFFFLLTLWAYARYIKSKVQSPKSKVAGEGTIEPERPAGKSRGQRGGTKSEIANPSIFHLPSSSFYWLCLLFFALGLMSKPMLVSLPFILLLLDIWPLGRIELKTKNLKLKTLFPLIAEKTPFLALSVLSSILTFLAQQRGGAVAALTTVPLGLRVENALVSCVTYLEKMLWPTGLAAYYPLPTSIASEQVAFAVAVLAAVSVIAIFTFRTRPYLAMGWLWYLGMLVPVIGLIQVGAQSHADRYTYLPLIGIFVAITWAASDWAMAGGERAKNPSPQPSPLLKGQGGRLGQGFARGASGAGPEREQGSGKALSLISRADVLAVCAIGLLIACAFGTRSQALVWKDSETLYRHALDVTSDNAFVHVNLGNELLKRQEYDEAVEHFAEAVKIDPRQAEPRGSWAFVLAKRSKLDEAVAQYRSAIELEPNRALTHFLLGNALMSQQKREEAMNEYETALRLDPSLWQAHTELGAALAQQGKVEHGAQEFEAALGMNPGDGTTERAVHPRRGPLPEGDGSAVSLSFAPPEMLRPKPDLARAHQQYGMLLARTGRLPQAEHHLREAIRLNPDLQTYQDLCLVLTAAGQPEAAVAQYREALRLRPDSAATLNNLAWILAANPNETVRNGPEAVKLAQQACKLTSFQEPVFIGTLAAAYAEASHFQDAVNTAEKAIALASSVGQTKVVERNQQLLELYRAGKPFHESPKNQTTDGHR